MLLGRTVFADRLPVDDGVTNPGLISVTAMDVTAFVIGLVVFGVDVVVAATIDSLVCSNVVVTLKSFIAVLVFDVIGFGGDDVPTTAVFIL